MLDCFDDGRTWTAPTLAVQRSAWCDGFGEVRTVSLDGRQPFKNEHEWHGVFFKRNSGRATAEVSAGGERPHARQTRCGDITFAPARTSFEGWTDGCEEYTYLAWFSAPAPILRDLVEAGHLPESSMRSGDVIYKGSPCFHDFRISCLLDQISGEIVNSSFASSLFLEAASMQLHIELIRKFTAYGDSIPDASSPSKGHRMNRIKDFMQSNTDRDLRLTELAAMAELSIFHFSRVFKSEVGVSPHVYFTQIRVARASELLRTTNLPLKAVAGRVGFASASKLCEAFRKAYNMTPTAFRRISVG